MATADHLSESEYWLEGGDKLITKQKLGDDNSTGRFDYVMRQAARDHNS